MVLTTGRASEMHSLAIKMSNGNNWVAYLITPDRYIDGVSRGLGAE